MTSTQVSFKQQLKGMGIDTSELSKLIQTVNTDAACDSNCQRQKKLNELQQIMMEAEKTEREAPQELAIARRNYYIYKDGQTNYNQTETQRLTKEAQIEIDKLKKEFDRRTKRTQTLIDEYEAIKVYNDNLDDLMEHNITKKQQLDDEIDNIKSSTFTNNRRYNYYEESINWQWYVNKFIRFIYWCCVITFIVYFLVYKGYYRDRKNIYIGLIILVLPFVISQIIVFDIYGYSIQNILDRLIQLFIFNKNRTDY